eukprot:CAMPEP_0175083874 /NCGR_PEP_ID=MMETSP0052_2-20121109/27668_1 /TAXON_ID=51329 ORGANISM="Polytomella parva, Strain SAG 63-3" /NCGR_SAMPLE_ID=MMETSP0052_2 /ASSEMBLY_ACC=CAM_ASM_000194 /LENGTH=40 /DNA_ID= /DNA_START= /DNA_END= /DNA_ORIENTATION=
MTASANPNYSATRGGGGALKERRDARNVGGAKDGKGGVVV